MSAAKSLSSENRYAACQTFSLSLVGHRVRFVIILSCSCRITEEPVVVNKKGKIA
jgi:hypothetical protein